MVCQAHLIHRVVGLSSVSSICTHQPAAIVLTWALVLQLLPHAGPGSAPPLSDQFTHLSCTSGSFLEGPSQ
jgi:hypothetical protein